MTDLEIVEGIRSGDGAAGEALFSRFEGPLLRYFRAALPDPQAAEDAAQEVFLRFIGSVRGGKSQDLRSLEAYLFTIARRLAIDIGRQWSRRPLLDSLDRTLNSEPDSPTLGESVPDRAEDARTRAERRERDRLVQEALRELDEETRAVLSLRHIEGMSSRAVAESLGIAEGTVWSRLHRGLETLRRRLAPRAMNEAPAGATLPATRSERR